MSLMISLAYCAGTTADDSRKVEPGHVIQNPHVHVAQEMPEEWMAQVDSTPVTVTEPVVAIVDMDEVLGAQESEAGEEPLEDQAAGDSDLLAVPELMETPAEDASATEGIAYQPPVSVSPFPPFSNQTQPESDRDDLESTLEDQADQAESAQVGPSPEQEAPALDQKAPAFELIESPEPESDSSIEPVVGEQDAGESVASSSDRTLEETVVESPQSVSVQEQVADEIAAPMPEVFVEEIQPGTPAEVVPRSAGKSNLGSPLLEDAGWPESSVPQQTAPISPPMVGRETATPPNPIRHIRSDWLDIRPRQIGTGNELVSVDRLPKDTSGLPEINSFSIWPYRYRADLDLCDFQRSSAFCHCPLHFEDPYLERLGIVRPGPRCCPTIHATAHMAWKTGLLPVSMALDPVWQRHRSGFRTPYWKKAISSVW